MTESAAIEHDTLAASARGARRRFLRHFGEMLLAMFAGMAVLGGVAELALAAWGSSLSDTSGATQVLVMGFNMTVAMVGWMAYRGHDRYRNAEMGASMALPTIATAALAWAGVLGSGGALAIQHVVMIPAMLGVMLWRFEHYSRAHASLINRSHSAM